MASATRALEAQRLAMAWEQRRLVSQGALLGPESFTVGTYNLLHPAYAEKYREPEGVDGVDGVASCGCC